MRTLPIRTSLSTRIAAGAALAVFLLIAIAAAGLLSISRLQRDAQAIERVADLDTRLERLLSFVKDAETGARGFIITGEERFLEPFHDAKRSIPAEVALIRASMADGGQLAKLREVVPLIERDLALMETNIGVRRRDGFPAAQRLVLSGAVKATTDSIRASFAVIGNAERAMGADRHRRTQASISSSRRLISVGMALATLFGIAGVYALNRGLSSCLESQAVAGGS